MTQQIKNATVSPIASLTEATEFLMCAVRAISHGAEVADPEVGKPIEWAVSKIAEAAGMTLQFERNGDRDNCGLITPKAESAKSKAA